MKIGKHGLALIKEFEGLRLKAYIPVKGDVPTIGWGHTRGVKMSDKITVKTAEKLLVKDLAPTVARVNRVVKVPLTQNQFDACVSLAFNIGLTAFSKSTLVKKLNETPLQFLRWNKFKKKPLAGLTRRRKAEMKLFNT